MEGDDKMKQEESAIMGYYNEICKRDLERMAEIECNPDYDDEELLDSTTPVEIDACIGFEDVCREFGPWVWSDEFEDYEASINDLKGPQCRLTSTVPRHVEEISKNLLKLKWDGCEQECFEGFGPWCKPIGYTSPEPVTPVKTTRKVRPKMRVKEKARDENENRATFDKHPKKEQPVEKIPEIASLTSHKTYSTPVDPIELKKRLTDLLIQRSAKGDQQAMQLKKINMKPLYFKKFICNTNGSTWLPRQKTIRLEKTVHRSKSEPVEKKPIDIRNLESEKASFDCEPVKLPPVAKVMTNKGDLNIVQRWPRVAIPHHVRKRNHSLHGRKQTKEAVSDSGKREIPKSKLFQQNVSMDELVREPEFSDEVTNKRWGRKLGELSKNTKTEIFKQFSNFDI